MSSIFYKQPREVLDYYINMTEYFEELQGDHISTPGNIEVEILPDDGELTALATTLVDDPATGFNQWFAGGLDGVKYKITYLVTTQQGRVEEIEMYLRIKEL